VKKIVLILAKVTAPLEAFQASAKWSQTIPKSQYSCPRCSQFCHIMRSRKVPP